MSISGRSLAFAMSLAGVSSPILIAPAAAQETEQTRTFDAVKAWGEFEFLLRQKYAYIDRDDFDVDAQLERSKSLAIEAKTDAELRRILHRTALTFGDPHLIVGPFSDDDYAIIMTGADLDARFDGGQAVIADVRRGSPAFDGGIRPGDRIVSIGGLPAAEAALKPYGDVLIKPTAAQRDYGLTLAVNGQRVGDRLLEIMDAQAVTFSLELQGATQWSRRSSPEELVNIEFVGDEGDIAHITLRNSLGNNDTITAFDEVMEQAAEARAIILDMRETPSGGNTEVARSIIGHFITEVRPYQMHRIPAFEREFTVPRQFVEYVYPRAPHFKGSVIVLHGRWTGSMGEGIVIGMDAAADSFSIGSNMGDLLGGLWNYELPSVRARVDLGGETLLHVDGTPREDHVADLVVYPMNTAQDGSDPGLSAALNVLNDED